MSDPGSGSSPHAFDSFPGFNFPEVDDRNLAALRQLDSLFLYSRLTTNKCSFKFILLLCYIPIGIALVLIRLLFALPIMTLLSLCSCPVLGFSKKTQTVIFRWELLVFFGIYITVTGYPSESARIWVCNHISEFDAAIIRCVSDPSILAYAMYEQMCWLKCTPIHIFSFAFVPPVSRSEGNAMGRNQVNQQIRHILETTSGNILVFPEGGLTNTPAGLLQYHKHMFGLGETVQPISLQISSPLPIALDTAYASFVANFLFFLFCPFRHCKMNFLPSSACQMDESSLGFARRVMFETSRSLNVPSSPFLYSDKKKWLNLKRKMLLDGYDFQFFINEESQTVEVRNFRRAKRGPFNKVLPVKSNDKDILIKYTREQWQMNSGDFSHLVFRGSSRSVI